MTCIEKMQGTKKEDKRDIKKEIKRPKRKQQKWKTD